MHSLDCFGAQEQEIADPMHSREATFPFFFTYSLPHIVSFHFMHLMLTNERHACEMSKSCMIGNL